MKAITYILVGITALALLVSVGFLGGYVAGRRVAIKAPKPPPCVIGKPATVPPKSDLAYWWPFP